MQAIGRRVAAVLLRIVGSRLVFREAPQRPGERPDCNHAHIFWYSTTMCLGVGTLFIVIRTGYARAAFT